MRSSRVAGQALRLATESARQPYICKACLAQGARQFHSSPPNAADVPFFQKMKTSLFGSKETKQAEESREKKQKKRSEDEVKRTTAKKIRGRDGNTYTVAKVYDSSNNSDYKPANTWAGLETIGSEKYVREQADKKEQYIGFMPPKRFELTNPQWQRLMHHITVEILTLAKAGRDVLEICYASTSSAKAWACTADGVVQRMNGETTAVSFQTKGSAQELLDEIPESEPESFSHVQGLAPELDNVDATEWAKRSQCTRVSLEEPVVKLAFLRRVMQLTGKRIPDHAISKVQTVQDIYQAFKVKEKPKMLADTEEMKALATSLPNVTVHNRKQTLVDKENSIGRWKVIEDELTLRNLPVFNKGKAPPVQSQSA